MAMPRKLERIPHKFVDWTTERVENGGGLVDVFCYRCNTWHAADRSTTLHRVIEGKFTGLCKKHRGYGIVKNGRLPRPDHPQVDWSITGHKKGKPAVQVTCPRCKQTRLEQESSIAERVREGSFTGFCYKDRLLGHPRKSSLSRPDHPLVDWNRTVTVIGKKQRQTQLVITCPKCGKDRLVQIGSVANKIRSGHGFSGLCLDCSGFKKRGEWITLSPGRKVGGKGYVRVTSAAVSPEDMDMFLAMKTNAGFVNEHRLVMAKQLGRPLKHNELVDHMDGIKTNNDPINLRLYIRGKNQPGETSGYGTYYHEWQLALTEIERLKLLIP